MTDQCDWPDTVDCRYNAASMADYRARHSDATLYLTFDDGPNNGTGVVLDALAAQGVRATFFLNSKYLHHPNPRVRSVRGLTVYYFPDSVNLRSRKLW